MIEVFAFISVYYDDKISLFYAMFSSHTKSMVHENGTLGNVLTYDLFSPPFITVLKIYLKI